MTKRPLVGQPSLFDDPPDPPGPVPSGGLVDVGTYEDGLREQIVRDSYVLREDLGFHVPSTEFFVQRIAAYRAELDRIRGSTVPVSTNS